MIGPPNHRLAAGVRFNERTDSGGNSSLPEKGLGSAARLLPQEFAEGRYLGRDGDPRPEFAFTNRHMTEFRKYQEQMDPNMSRPVNFSTGQSYGGIGSSIPNTPSYGEVPAMAIPRPSFPSMSLWQNNVPAATIAANAKAFQMGAPPEDFNKKWTPQEDFQTDYDPVGEFVEKFPPVPPITILSLSDPNLFSHIGGCQEILQTIINSCLLPRTLNNQFLAQIFGTQQIKGVILTGPPGTAKTLTMTSLAMALHGREPKIVKASELLSKYVGESAEKINELFRDSEEEWDLRGTESALHIIIFDEFDALGRKRSSSDSTDASVYNQVVSQILTRLDGPKKQDNLLVVATTNFIEAIDPALIRPGRFELVLHTQLPNEQGREEILKIHTKLPREAGRMPDVSLSKIAKMTPNATGAELAGLVRRATHHAIMDYRPILLEDYLHGKNEQAVLRRLQEKYIETLETRALVLGNMMSKSKTFRSMMDDVPKDLFDSKSGLVAGPSEGQKEKFLSLLRERDRRFARDLKVKVLKEPLPLLAVPGSSDGKKPQMIGIPFVGVPLRVMKHVVTVDQYVDMRKRILLLRDLPEHHLKESDGFMNAWEEAKKSRYTQEKGLASSDEIARAVLENFRNIAETIVCIHRPCKDEALEEKVGSMYPDLIIKPVHFERALEDIEFQFGRSQKEEKQNHAKLVDCSMWQRNGLVLRLQHHLKRLMSSDSSRSSQCNILLHGEAGSGKTDFSRYFALSTDIPFVRFIRSEMMTHLNEHTVCQILYQAFEEAAHSRDGSIIVIDNLENLIRYAYLHNTFSNDIAQTIRSLLSSCPGGHKTRVFSLVVCRNPKIWEHLFGEGEFEKTFKEIVEHRGTIVCNEEESLTEEQDEEIIKIIIDLLRDVKHEEEEISYEEYLEKEKVTVGRILDSVSKFEKITIKKMYEIIEETTMTR